jgi:molybdopterin/thiamine biosynthesis adenylyltransferase
MDTEGSCAGAAFGATRLPFVGLTLAGDSSWSARFWQRSAPREYNRKDCGTVRVLGDSLRVTYLDALAPIPVPSDEQVRTVSAWGPGAQADLVRLRTGVVGNGSVGGFIGQSLAHVGFEDVMPIDFDRIEKHNLDRLSYATRADVGRLKVEAMAEHLAKCATASPFRAEPVPAAVYEEDGFRAALDCDVLFSCVDRPWGRYVLNLISYSHLIPVIDGGIGVRTNRHGRLVAADWRAHTATVGRPCLQCLHQYDPGLVQAERQGLLDDPSYIEGLPKDHPLKTRENVFPFSMSCASMQMLQALAFVLAPLSQPNPGAQLYHFVGNITEEPSYTNCHPECQFPKITGLGDHAGIVATGIRPAH